MTDPYQQRAAKGNDSPGSVNVKPRSLLAILIRTLVLFAIIIFSVLNFLGIWHEKELKELPEANRNRYFNERLYAALQTLEFAVMPIPGKGVAGVPLNAQALLDGVPECRKSWDNVPGRFEVMLDKLRNRKTDMTTTAERMAFRLEALEVYFGRQGQGGNRRLDNPVYLDAARWHDAIRVGLNTPIRPKGYAPDVELRMQCSDIVAAVRTLMPESCRQALLLPEGGNGDTQIRRNCRALENLSWQGTVVGEVKSKWADYQMVAVPRNLIEQRNPWQGVPGCIYWQDNSGQDRHYYLSDQRFSNRRVCEDPKVNGLTIVPAGKKLSAPQLVAVAGLPDDKTSLNDPRWSVPPSLDLILRPLDALRQPGSSLYQDYTRHENRQAPTPESYRFGPNQADIGGVTLDVGFSVDLTIDRRAQALAQQVAACYTGAQAICSALGIQRAEDEGQPIGHKLLENALVRMAGVAIIDIASGRIEAVAGALSPCARQDYDGPGRGSDCESRLPWTPTYRPDMLENPALFHDAMPASTIKPIMAAAFLGDGAYGGELLAREHLGGKPAPRELRYELMKSDSASFLDRMFCNEKNFDDCLRPWQVQRVAGALGWNKACEDGNIHCGKRDVLFGYGRDGESELGMLVPRGRSILYGRLLTQPVKNDDSRFAPMPSKSLNPEIVRDCANGNDNSNGTKDDWEKCKGGEVVDVVAEGWGQGHARATAVGVAGMMALMGAAANERKEMPVAHLIERLRGTGGNGESELQTAVQRFNLNTPLPVTVAPPAAKIILDGLNWSHRGGTASSACTELWNSKVCNEINWIAGKTGTPTFRNDGKTLKTIEENCRQGKACSTMRPYKWYTAVFRLDNGGQWQKAIAVLTERNWDIKSQKIHGAGDNGPNPAAEIALNIVSRLRDNSGGHAVAGQGR